MTKTLEILKNITPRLALRGIFLILLLIGGFGVSVAEEPVYSENIKFDTQKHDFGVVKEKSGIVSYTFTFRNGTKKPMAISHVNYGCNCLKAEYTKDAIAPGGTGKVKVSYNPANRPGFFSKEIVVLCNGDRLFTRIWVKGTVEGFKHKVTEDYPYAWGNGLYTNLKTVVFGTMSAGETHQMKMKVANDSKRPMKVEFRPVGNNDVDFGKPFVLKPDERTTITMAYSLSKPFKGERSTKIQIIVNGKPLPKTITANVIGNGKKTILRKM